MCFSPETFVKIKDGRIYSYPMKGTLDATIPDAERVLMDDEKGYIGIEDNKPAAIKLFEEKTANDSRIEIVPLAKKYPQGGEKQLVDAVIRRQVPAPPAIPVNVGAIVQNVGTAFAVYQAVMKNKPLFERYTTVTGKQVKTPGNFLVRMGTPFSQMIRESLAVFSSKSLIAAGLLSSIPI